MGSPDRGFIADTVAEVTQDLAATAAARRAGTRHDRPATHRTGPGTPHPVATTRAIQEQAAAVHDQAIRDAKAAGHPVTRIAGILGVTNRMRLYGVLDKPPKSVALATKLFSAGYST